MHLFIGGTGGHLVGGICGLVLPLHVSNEATVSHKLGGEGVAWLVYAGHAILGIGRGASAPLMGVPVPAMGAGV